MSPKHLHRFQWNTIVTITLLSALISCQSPSPTGYVQLEMMQLAQNAECIDPSSASSRNESISLQKCINICQSKSFEDCLMIQYYDELAGASRCYIFAQFCDLTVNVGDRAEISHIYYKNQFTTQFCTDYNSFDPTEYRIQWEDKFGLSCNDYLETGHCLNGTVSDSSFDFTDAMDTKFGWTAMETCCNCGGGKPVYDNIAVSFIDNINFNHSLEECTFKDDEYGILGQFALWNNFALYQLIRDINNKKPVNEQKLNNDILIYTEINNLDPTITYNVIICDFSSYDYDITNIDVYIDFFIFASLQYPSQSVYYINSEWFDIDEYIISPQVIIDNRSYTYCTDKIQNSTSEAIVNIIVPCFEENDIPTSVPTMKPTSSPNKEKMSLWETIYTNIIEYAFYIAMGSCSFVIICILCIYCIVALRRNNIYLNKEDTPDKMYNEIQMGMIKSANSGDKDSTNSSSDSDEDSASDTKPNGKVPFNDYNNSFPKKKLKREGILYHQTGYYDEKQMENIDGFFEGDFKKAPKMLFGDNYSDRKRDTFSERQKFGGQSKVMGHWDRKYGFGIPTSFENAAVYGFDYNDHNFKILMKVLFDELKQHILGGGDIIVPYPTAQDLQERPQKYYKNNIQLIHHNLGVGISTLPFRHLMIIQQNVNLLKKFAHKVIKIDQVFYDDSYNEVSEDELIIPSGNGDRGLLVFQTAWFSKEQMNYIRSKYNTRQGIKTAGKMLFGENDIDGGRNVHTKREHWGGQAGIMGFYDRLFAYGIITTFYERKKIPKLKEYMNLMDQQFQPLQQHLLSGYDVVVPVPSKSDVSGNKKRYCRNGKQVIFHNLGTGIAMLPFEHIQYIQFKIDELKKYAKGSKTVEYYNYSPKNVYKKQSSRSILDKFGRRKKKKKGKKNKGKRRYDCPLCSEKKHYLINLKNCKHKICEQCLRDHIFDQLDYAGNEMKKHERFRCWTAPIGKCDDGELCLEDVVYPDNKCECDQCQLKDTGTDTILDADHLKIFRSVMEAINDNNSRWDVDECPNPECLKPFKIDKPWRDSKHKYDLTKQNTLNAILHKDKCNCCGRKRENDQTSHNIPMFMEESDDKKSNDDVDEEKKDIELSIDIQPEIGGYQSYNNCGICNYYYCYKCRTGCFYEIESNYTVKPPTPVADAMIDFNRGQKLKHHESVASHSYHSSSEEAISVNLKKEIFECCEVCWYRFYCRQCPYCDYNFCGICNIEWKGQNTLNWNEKLNNLQMEKMDYMKNKIDKNPFLNYDDLHVANNHSYGVSDGIHGRYSVAKLIDEKNGNHNNEGHHSCKEQLLKIAEKEKNREQTREKKRNDQLRMMQRKLDEEKFKTKQMQYKMEQNVREMEEFDKEKREIKHDVNDLQKTIALQKARIAELERDRLKYEKNKAVLVAQKSKFEAQKYQHKAEEEEKKAIEIDKENQELKKKIGFVIIWQWKENDGTWKSYNNSISTNVEKLKVGKSYQYTFSGNNQTYKITKKTATTAIQINTNTNVSRQVKQTKKERGMNNVEYPEWWNMSGIDLNNEANAQDPKYAKPKVITLNLNTSPGKDVVNNFKKTCTNRNIVKIESVQNQMLYDSYWNARRKLIKLIGEKKLNERDVFHGTKQMDVMGKVQTEGFRKEFNNTAAYGMGTYFARDASYSVSYSSNNGKGTYQMFQCRVMIGESHIGNSTYKLTAWPHKSNGLIYDSLVDNINNPSIFVIHENVRAYPMFIIHFK